MPKQTCSSVSVVSQSYKIHNIDVAHIHMYKSLKSNRDRWRNVAVQKENVAKKFYFLRYV